MNEISHKGVVIKIESGIAEVEISGNVDCDACGIKKSCIAIGNKDNRFFVDTAGQDFGTGDQVEMLISKSSAMNAVLWAYVFPFIVLMVSIIVFYDFMGELAAALAALVVVAVYYLFVYLNKRFFEKKFRLKIKHITYE